MSNNDNYKEGSSDPYKSETDYAALEAVPLMAHPTIEPQQTAHDRFNAFPGNRRTILPLAGGPPPDTVLVKTAGNALQAVPRSIMQQQDRLVAVRVPENVNPGDMIYVQYTHGGDPQQQLMQATIPAGALPGHTFFVQVPDVQQEPVVAAQGEAIASSAASAVVVPGQNSAGDLYLQEDHPKPDKSNNV